MSETLAAVPAGAVDDPGTPVRQVADNFVALMRSFGRAKARFVAAAEHDVEWTAQIILRQLSVNGPMRASALADCLRSDPSTVSRQVAALVKDGLLERRSDAEDGRASILVLTPRADEVIAHHDQLRLEHFATMLADWDEPDLERFAELLARFTVDFDAASATIRTATPEQTAPRHVSAEGKN
jgi:DNA-binding MarR family transcriptional regulator